MATRLEASRLLTRNAAHARDGDSLRRRGWMAKLFSSETALFSPRGDACAAGNGFMADLPSKDSSATPR